MRVDTWEDTLLEAFEEDLEDVYERWDKGEVTREECEREVAVIESEIKDLRRAIKNRLT